MKYASVRRHAFSRYFMRVQLSRPVTAARSSSRKIPAITP
jgi:hypothetical protein